MNRTEMKDKALLIVGEGLGKSRLARMVAKSYKNAVIINGNAPQKEITLYPDEQTPDLITIEDVKLNHVENYFNSLTQGFRFKRDGEKSFLAKPDVIIICSEPINELVYLTPWKNRFSIIHFLPND